MKIIIDAFGGDNCPDVPVKAAVRAVKKLGCEMVLVGDSDKINSLLVSSGISDSRISVVHASEVITNEEKPATAVRTKKGSTLVVGAKLLSEGGGDAFVSAGSTGALLAASLFNVGRISGVRRPALAVVLASVEGRTLLLDCGANAECKSEDLYTFAAMGSIYMKKLFGISSPRIALLSNGTEQGKGNSILKETYYLLEESSLNFVGNLEGRNINLGGADVMVSDGFSGNVALKSVEGAAKMISCGLKNKLFKNYRTKLGALLLKPELKEFSAEFDYKQYGGAPLLGIKMPVIKAHGSSDEISYLKAIEQACRWAKENVNSEIEMYFSSSAESLQ